MKKIVIIGTVLAILITIIFTLWVIFTTFKFFIEGAPQWFSSVEKALTGLIRKAEEYVPGIKEKTKEVVPDITEKIKELTPVGLPEKDVSGEDIKGIPRHPDMVRTFYEIKDKKRTIVYKGRVDLQSVINYYDKKMAALGFKKKIVFAIPDEEIHSYSKANRELEFRFKKIGLPGLTTTELTIKEI